MPYGFRTQAEYYLRLAELADVPEEKARLTLAACTWHRLAQQIDLRRSQNEDDHTELLKAS